MQQCRALAKIMSAKVNAKAGPIDFEVKTQWRRILGSVNYSKVVHGEQ
jgi:hypothetical protein